MAVLTAVSTVVVTAVSAVKTAVSTAVGTAMRVSEIALSSSGRTVQAFKLSKYYVGRLRRATTNGSRVLPYYNWLQPYYNHTTTPYYNPILQPHFSAVL